MNRPGSCGGGKERRGPVSGGRGKQDKKNSTDAVPQTRDRRMGRWRRKACALGSV